MPFVSFESFRESLLSLAMRFQLPSFTAEFFLAIQRLIHSAARARAAHTRWFKVRAV